MGMFLKNDGCSICGENAYECKCTPLQKERYKKATELKREVSKKKEEERKAEILQRKTKPGKPINAEISIDDYDRLKKVPKPDLVMKYAPVGEARESETADAFPEGLTRENKNWIMLALGFEPSGNNMWTHDSLGLGAFIEFDICNGDITQVVKLLLEEGNRVGKYQLKQSLKNLLGLR